MKSDGITVKVLIYRLQSEGGWSLEVVDHQGASTVWSDLFATDQDADDNLTKQFRRKRSALFWMIPPRTIGVDKVILLSGRLMRHRDS